ncbi:mannose-1-phosphate guanylyltransferase [Micromonospora yangpuensis]|uniref:mannose-1-phosphate guanylyltransferase n=1 Tax=Micromonospora yangpuensis TaxID=683228 RepID=A0A1C6U7K9_9ACTN|nr:sugar phosphate nucleotidyltransferase [Micromonospora yangpuensis]SCL49928.1 mannose-6-phosphate isomerase, type 2 [Micromonospora yangpuensis]
MLYAVIPAGGSGTRLWPLSRAGHPKFLHPLTGSSASLLQETVRRLAPLSTPERTLVVTGVAHATAVARQLTQLPEENILVEPSPRDSCAAIALAAAVIATRDPEAVMGSFAADHVIGDPQRWAQTVREAVHGAEQGLLMTVGITPTRPETGYGYLQTGDPVGDGPLRPVAEFKEKPAVEVAEAYLRSGHHLWNASMFVWRVDVFLAELARQQPDLYAGVTAIAAAWGTPAQDEELGRVWPTLPKISVDYAVMEGAAAAGRVATVPGDFGWNDVGDFHTLGDVLPTDPAGNVVLGTDAKADVLLRDSSGLVVVSQSGRLVSVLGMRDTIVVDTADAVLVCARERAQDVKALVDELKQRGEEALI